MRNFDRADFKCRCDTCAKDPDSPVTINAVIAAVQRLRDRLGAPVSISRGVSCAEHNKAVGGAPDSRHLPEHRDAVDINTYGSSALAMRIVTGAIAEPAFTCIRVYDHHVHLDCRPLAGVRWFLASPE